MPLQGPSYCTFILGLSSLFFETFNPICTYAPIEAQAGVEALVPFQGTLFRRASVPGLKPRARALVPLQGTPFSLFVPLQGSFYCALVPGLRFLGPFRELCFLRVGSRAEAQGWVSDF